MERGGGGEQQAKHKVSNSILGNNLNPPPLSLTHTRTHAAHLNKERVFREALHWFCHKVSECEPLNVWQLLNAPHALCKRLVALRKAGGGRTNGGGGEERH